MNKLREEVAREKADILAEAETVLALFLPKSIANLIKLANGGYQRVEEKWAPGEGESSGMVLVERKVSVAEPDRVANQYLIDRVLGKPTERHEHEFSKLSDEELLEAAQALA